MATRYLTVASLKLYVRSEITTVDDVFYDEAIQAAESWLDGQCHRRIIVASATSARSYNPPVGASRYLYIHDCTAITSITENGSALASGTAFQAEPLNALSDEGEAWPYYRIVKPYTRWFSTTNLASIVVTATWGWPAIPPMILEACKIVAKDYFLQRDVAHGVIGITEVGGVGTRENRLVQDAVARYMRTDKIGLAA